MKFVTPGEDYQEKIGEILLKQYLASHLATHVFRVFMSIFLRFRA